MANNRKMRKFEGTCYIPGEQLAMMAKYYRGANLNLNLTLVEDDMGLMKESLDNSCWCSKLDEVDRMKLQHMKGDQWKINHDHHLQGSDSVGRGGGNCCFSPVKLSREIKVEPETRVDKGTDTISFYNQSPRRDYDPRYDSWKVPPSMRDNYYGDRNFRRSEGPRRGFLPSQDVGYNRPSYNTHAYPMTYSQCPDSENRYRRNLDREMEDDISSRWASEKSEDIKCAVCKKDVCAVCKNPLRGWPCHCKCVIPNAGLCNECDLQCDKESDKEAGVSKDQEQTQTNLSNLMLLLMSSQMFNRPQNTEPPCRCHVGNSKPVSVYDSDSASGSTSCSCCTEKVQKIFFYDCESSGKTKNDEAKKSKKKKKKNPSYEEDSSASSKNCDCCKCPKKENQVVKPPDTHDTSSNPQVTKESNSSKRSAKSKQPYSSQNPSMKVSGKPINVTKPTATSNKGHPSDKGKKGGGGHSSFRQPSENNVNQSSSGKKDKTNKKRRRIEERTDSDNESLTSRQSDRDIDRKKSSQSSSVDLKDFLVCLPKIKSDLEQLLMRIQDEGPKTQMQQRAPHQSGPVSQPYFTNVRVRSTVPFITHPSANAHLPNTDPINYGPSFKFHPKPNFGYDTVHNHDLPSTQWDEFNEFDQRVSHRRHENTVYPMEQQYRCIFPSLPSSKKISGTPAKPQNNTRGECGFNDYVLSSRQKPDTRVNVTRNPFRPTYTYKHPFFEKNSIHQGFQTSNNLWKFHQRNSEHTSIEETFNLTNMDPSRQQNALHSYNHQNTSDFFDQRLVDHQLLIPKELSSPEMKESKTAHLKNEMDSSNKGVEKRLEDNQVRMPIEGSIQLDKKCRSGVDIIREEGSSKNACRNTVVMCNDSTFKANPSNEPVQSPQSSDSKHTSDQFISAVEVNDQLSEDTFLQEGEHKQTFGKQDQQVNEECERQRANRSIGPGQFRVAMFNASGFNSPNGPPGNIKHSHTQNKRKMHKHDDVVTQVCSTEEGQINAQRVIVKNCSFASTGGHDFIKSSSLDVIISEEKVPKKFSSNGDRLGFTVQPHESEIALSETLVKTTDSHDVVLSNMELSALSPALKGDAQYYNIIDQIKSTSAVMDNSGDSFQCGLAHSSLPSSEEDMDLSQLPTESTELIADNDKKYCKRRVLDKNISRAFAINDTRTFKFKVHAENELEKYRSGQNSKRDIQDIAGGIRHRTTLQAAKFKLAQEAIQSMVQNVNEVLASIDSDSESKMYTTSSNLEDRERQSFFVHLGRDESKNKQPQDNALSKIQKTIRNVCYDKSATKPSTSKTGHFRDTSNQFDDEYVSGVTEDHIGSPQSLQSFSSNELRLGESSSRTPNSLNAASKTISRERNYFVLDSGRSNSSVFTERLRQSLAKETSSPNLSAVLTPEEYTSSGNLKRTCSPKPLKRRSWIPPPE